MRKILEIAQSFSQRFISFYKREGFAKVFLRANSEILTLTDIPWLKFSWLLPGPTNKCEIRIFALRRSGQHAIINWIRYQARGRHCLLNECQPNTNPFLTCNRGNSLIATPIVEHSCLYWDQEIAGKLSKKGVLLYNYEDCCLEDVLTEHFTEHRRQWLGESLRTFDVLILRDPFNLFASKLRWAYGTQYKPTLDSFPELVELWKAYAKEFIGETNYLSNKLTISYNKWFTDKEYRIYLSDQLGLSWSDKGMYKVARWGPVLWGDTFDSLDYDGRIPQMKVLERWKNYQDDPFYLRIFTDKELVELSEIIFGYLPGIEVLLRARI